ncbi:MAG: amino acid ABC transporter ATP-binding protein [Planctomycetota bacterium]|nr:amino acid ABC transporter ATP-binding protein [Planctomycetota bacterium]
MNESAPASVAFAGVTKRFGDLTVLDGIDLEVHAGEVLALLGPSGGGKSTLLRLINGLEIRDGGTLRVLDRDVPLGPPAALPSDPWWRDLRQEIGFVFQAFHLYPHKTALENVTLAPVAVRGRAVDEVEVEGRALLERVGLAHKADAMPRQLSGGQQQRVAIARALAMDPRILLFDEPTSALDPEMSAEVIEVMRALAAQHDRTLIVVTHEFGFAREAADRVAFLEHGRILEVGPAREVLESPQHERARAFFERVL